MCQSRFGAQRTEVDTYSLFTNSASMHTLYYRYAVSFQNFDNIRGVFISNSVCLQAASANSDYGPKPQLLEDSLHRFRDIFI